MEFRTYGLSDIGCVRQENQDTLLICEPIESGVLETKGTLVVVADGMGGLESGALASRLVAETMERCYYSAPGPLEDALKQAAEEANRIVHERAQSLPAGSQMGSTLTAACFRKDFARIVQAGDSRAYHVRAGQLRQVTKDHSLVQEFSERRQVEMPADVWSVHRNIVTRGMGLMPEVEVDLFEIDDLLPGDVFLLSSDGFHELVRSEEIVEVLTQNQESGERAAEEFIALARERGGADNITVALIEVGAPVAAVDDGPAPRRVADRYGWFLPLALFLSFAVGVLLTTMLETRPAATPSALEKLERSIAAPLRKLRHEELDTTEMRDLRERLDRLERLLQAEFVRARQAAETSQPR